MQPVTVKQLHQVMLFCIVFGVRSNSAHADTKSRFNPCPKRHPDLGLFALKAQKELTGPHQGLCVLWARCDKLHLARSCAPRNKTGFASFDAPFAGLRRSPYFSFVALLFIAISCFHSSLRIHQPISFFYSLGSTHDLSRVAKRPCFKVFEPSV